MKIGINAKCEKCGSTNVTMGYVPDGYVTHNQGTGEVEINGLDNMVLVKCHNCKNKNPYAYVDIDEPLEVQQRLNI